MTRSKGIEVYPRPKIERLCIAYANINELSYSEGIEDMINHFFRSQPDLQSRIEQKILLEPTLTERKKRK